MSFELRILLIPITLLVSIGVGARMTYGQVRMEQVVQTQKSKSTQSQSDKSNPASANDCSLLTSAMLEKALGQAQSGKPQAQEGPPMYGGASGWICTYYVGTQNHGGAKVVFSVYTEASAAKAKQDFDTYAIVADNSRGKPSIGDSAYWVAPDTNSLFIYVLKGKVHFSIELMPVNEKQLRDLAAEVAARI
ncbi:MAG: hypothetical protein JO159_11205 [Acidobacteria bacterium]|nr:hypothetical protein [Acidobacteriota bacterium]